MKFLPLCLSVSLLAALSLMVAGCAAPDDEGDSDVSAAVESRNSPNARLYRIATCGNSLTIDVKQEGSRKTFILNQHTVLKGVRECTKIILRTTS